MIRRKNKTVTENIEEAMDRWYEHFEALLNQPGQCDLQQTSRLMGKERPQDVSLGLPFTMEEIEYAINGLPDNKAYRHDGCPIDPMTYVSSDESLTYWLHVQRMPCLLTDW